MKHVLTLSLIALISFGLFSCGGNKDNDGDGEDSTKTEMEQKLDQYALVELKTDISHLTEAEKQMLPLLFDIASIMEELYWMQTIGNKEEFLNAIEDENIKEFALINFGPWDRLDGNAPFVDTYGEKPAGANFYPSDMTEEEFNALENENKTSLYTMIQRDEAGALEVVWYHEYFAEKLQEASDLLLQASEICEDPIFKKYLELRSEALMTSDYQASDFAWMDMKTSESNIDFVVGPIENYEDALYGYKAAFESFILLKDKEWSDKLARFNAMLPELQKNLPVDEKYKTTAPGSDSDINAYEVIFYAGDCNAGSKTIAINLPNDPKVHETKGSRKFQLKNSLRAKFDMILVPISDLLIAEDQRQHITFTSFFENVMFHEVAHGMGVKFVIDNPQISCREALAETYSTLEEGKADILGLYLVTQLYEQGELTDGVVMDNYVTFLAGLFRSIRFGASSSHGKANLMRYNFFVEKGAFTRTEEGIYSINFDEAVAATEELINIIISIQGDGDKDAAQALIDKYLVMPEELETDLETINNANIPVDIVFDQGKAKFGF
jgi:Peptidase family M49